MNTEGSNTFEIISEGEKVELGQVKLAPEISRFLLSVDQLTDDNMIYVTFKGNECTISHSDTVIESTKKGTDYLYKRLKIGLSSQTVIVAVRVGETEPNKEITKEYVDSCTTPEFDLSDEYEAGTTDIESFVLDIPN